MRVLIVGGGIGGLATSIALRGAGVDPIVVERREMVADEGAAITIPSNGTRALSELRLLNDLRPLSVVITHFEYVYRNETLLSAPLDEGFDGWPWLALRRRDLLRALATRSNAVRYGIGVARVDERDRDVSVAFTDGSTDVFDVVVGADGTHSTVRACVNAEAQVEWAGLLYWRAMIRDRSRAPKLRGHLGEGALFGVFPGGPGYSYIWGALPAASPVVDPVAGRRKRMIDRFAHLGDEPRQFLARTRSDEEFSCTPPEWVRLDEWHTDRVVLIGDAAHACPPFMAEGACLAMEDGIVLADCLSTQPLREALETYEMRRRPRADTVHSVVSRTVDSLADPSGPGARADLFRSLGPSALLAQFDPLMEAL